MDRLEIRAARAEDCADIARLFLISSDGLAAYIWEQEAAPGESLEAVGARRYARTGVPFSYVHCSIAEISRTTAGMAHAFAMPPRTDAAPSADPVLQPYAELEDPGSLYVSGVAVYPHSRNRGIGTALLAALDERARDLDLPRLSLICFERNEAALRLYRRLGFEEADRRAVVPHRTLHYRDGDAILMVRPRRG
jgi:ribosomal protein S18 acetylase RimI-like enzyme